MPWLSITSNSQIQSVSLWKSKLFRKSLPDFALPDWCWLHLNRRLWTWLGSGKASCYWLTIWEFQNIPNVSESISKSLQDLSAKEFVKLWYDTFASKMSENMRLMILMRCILQSQSGGTTPSSRIAKMPLDWALELSWLNCLTFGHKMPETIKHTHKSLLYSYVQSGFWVDSHEMC